MLVSLQNVCKVYHPEQNPIAALNGINLSIQQGEFISIVGTSGSGKSTLMNILGCLDVPDQGVYLLEEKNIMTYSDKELSEIRNKKIGFIFQGFNLIPTLTALENVELPLLYRGMRKPQRRQLAMQSLDRVGLALRYHHRPTELSGGQQQRVAIARAIAARPPIILADEPTGNLDSKSGSEVLSILRELYEEGKTVILITHDNEIAAQTNRIVRILDGKLASDSYQRKGL